MPPAGGRSQSGNFTTFICGACALSRKYLLPLPRTVGGEGAAKIEDIPPYCTRTLYTGPPGRGRRGSWHILGSLFWSGRGGEGDVTREGGPPGSHSGPGLDAWSSVPCWSRLLPQSLLSDVPPHLALPPASVLASEGPPWLLGSLYSPPSLEGPREGLWLLGGSPRSPVTCAHAGEGVRVAEAAVQTWGQGRGSSQSLGEFADDANQGCVLILEPLVVSAEVRQGL